MLSAPLFAWLKLRSTYYLLTDKRLVVLTDGRTRTAQSYQLDGLSNLVRTEYGERGDLVWTVLSQPVETPRSSLAKTGLPQPAVTSRSSLAHTVMSATTVSLLGIKEPRKVEKLVVDCCQKLLEKKHEY